MKRTNKELWDHCNACHGWSDTEVLIQYLREKEVFSHSNGDTKANPYWYGSTVSPSRLREVCEELLKENIISADDLEERARDAKEDLNSPIVRLMGIWIIRETLKKSVD